VTAKGKAAMTDSEPKHVIPPQRLCSEIQLFDLCELDSCNHKNGRYCTDPALLGRFEKITEDELRAPERNIFEEIDDAEADDGDGGGYDDEDEFAMENFEGGEDDDWEDKG
jgi:hypothetical protein